MVLTTKIYLKSLKTVMDPKEGDRGGSRASRHSTPISLSHFFHDKPAKRHCDPPPPPKKARERKKTHVTIMT